MIPSARVAHVSTPQVSAAIIREDAGRIAFLDQMAANSEAHQELDDAVERTAHLESTLDMQRFTEPPTI